MTSRHEDEGPDPIVIRQATTDDLPALASLLATAFDEDPIAQWLMPEDEHRRVALPGFFGLIAREICLPQGMTYVTDNLGAAALWEPPFGEWSVEPDIPDSAWVEIVGPDVYPRLSAFGDLMNAHRPEERHVYLSLIGALPEYRGQGLAAALLDAGLMRWDRERVPTNLVSTNSENLPFYESRGYRVIAEAALPDGGPHIWDMWREPQ